MGLFGSKSERKKKRAARRARKDRRQKARQDRKMAKQNRKTLRVSGRTERTKIRKGTKKANVAARQETKRSNVEARQGTKQYAISQGLDPNPGLSKFTDMASNILGGRGQDQATMDAITNDLLLQRGSQVGGDGDSEKKDNTILYISIAGGVLALIIVSIIVFKK